MSRRLFQTRHAPRGGGRLRLFILVPALIAAGWFAGFLHYVFTLPQTPADLDKAQGIVALTGGAERIVAAMRLLAAGKGERLLISGVHSETNAADLKRLIDDPAGRFECCVDLDRAARNTVGNAIETARWARRNGYRALIVVTAQYHMPRSLLELSHALPEAQLTPYPVLTSQVQAGRWWYSPRVARLLAIEYTKCLVARMRLALASQLDAR